MHSRRNHGATLGVVVVCCVILVIVIIGLFHITMIFGGSQELRNSVDAGALSLGQQAVKLKTTPLIGGPEAEFTDVCDQKGSVGLMNINRVIGKAYLMNANAQAMSSDGMGSGNSSTHANDVAQASQQICDRITAQLKDTAKTQPFFNDFIKVNSIKMFGKAEVKATSDDWNVACVDRDDESNLYMEPDQLPDSYAFPADALKSVTERNGTNRQYLKGYHSIPANSRHFNFVTFKYDEKPHLINGFYFTAQQKLAVTDWTSPVPNALSTKGTTDKIQLINTANAYVVTNPQRQFQAAIPHGYIQIHLNENEAKWKYGIGPAAVTLKTTHYGYYPGQSDSAEFPAGTGHFQINVILGNQFPLANLDYAINPIYAGENTKIMKALLQRVRQIKHDCTMDELHSLLKGCTTIGQDSGDFFIFATYDTSDNTNPTLHCQRDFMAQPQALWLKKDNSDGSEKKDFDTDSKPYVPFVPTPNVIMQQLIGTGCKPGPFGGDEEGHYDWQPGTGYGGCLGKLTVGHTTGIYFSGACTLL